MAQQGITVINKATHTSKVVTGKEVALSARSVVELPLAHAQVKTLARSGADLVITTESGDTIVLHGFFSAKQGPGHSDLVLQDSSGYWLADLSDMNALPMDTAVDPGNSNVFSSINSADPLLAGLPPVAANSTPSPDAKAPPTTPPAPADTASAHDPVSPVVATTPNAAGATGAGAGAGSAAAGSYAGTAVDTSVGAALNWLPLVGGVGIATAAIVTKAGPPVAAASPQLALISGVSQDSSGHLIVTGHGTSGDTVKVTFPDGSTATATADASGQYSATSTSTPQNSTGTITAVETSASGGIGSSTTFQWNAPQAPTISGAPTANSDGGLTVVGTATAGNTVTATFPDGSTATGTVDASTGAYTITTQKPQTTGNVSVTSSDTAGDTSAPVSVQYTDTTAPQPPSATYAVNADGGLTVYGTAEAGSTVTVKFPDGSSAAATAGASGFYSITTHTPQSNGPVSVTATDAAHNVSQPSASQTYTDTTSPLAPAVGITPDTADSGITVQGSAEANSKIAVTYPDGSTANTTAGADGTYSVNTTTAQSAGTVSVIATDAAGNASPATTVNYTTGNALSYVSVSYVSANADGGVTVVGGATAGATVTVTYPDQSTASAVADATGHYSITTHTPQTSGAVEASIPGSSATGAVNNPGNVVYTDITPPEAPAAGVTANSADSGVTVAGSAEPGSIVTVTYPDGNSASVTAGSDGYYTLATHAAQTSGTVVVTATDAAHNQSAATDVSYTAGVSQPAYVSVTSASANADGGITVTGNAPAGSVVTVTYPDGSKDTATASATGSATTGSANGQYSVTTHASQANGEVLATATDTDGHASSQASFAYTDPNASTLAISPDSGASATDLITSHGGLILSGTLEHVLTTAPGSAESLQINLDAGGSGIWTTVSDVTGAKWSYDASADAFKDGVYVIGERVLGADGHTVMASSAQQIVVSGSGKLNLSLSEVLSDTAALGGQHLMIGSGGDSHGNNAVVTSVTLSEGVGSGANQWTDTGATTIGGITYDIYHNLSQTTTVADLLIQHGLTVTGP